MMLLLVRHIMQSLVKHGLAHGERPIASLPCETAVVLRDGFYPLAAFAFGMLHHMRQTHVSRQKKQYVHVVAYASDLQHAASCFIDEPSYVRMYHVNILVLNQWTCRADMKYQMDIDFA